MGTLSGGSNEVSQLQHGRQVSATCGALVPQARFHGVIGGIVGAGHKKLGARMSAERCDGERHALVLRKIQPVKTRQKRKQVIESSNEGGLTFRRSLLQHLFVDVCVKHPTLPRRPIVLFTMPDI